MADMTIIEAWVVFCRDCGRQCGIFAHTQKAEAEAARREHETLPATNGGCPGKKP